MFGGKDKDLKKKLSGIQNLINDPKNPGLAMCAFGLAEVFLNSKTERRQHSIRYLGPSGELRAVADLQDNEPHGDLLVFYPDGKIWMKGAYRKGTLVWNSFTVFMPDGSVAKGSPRDNVIPFPKKT